MPLITQSIGFRMPVTNLPDSHHFMRHVSWARLLKDEADENKVIGFLPHAFERRPDEDGLSGNWMECFADPATRTRDCVWAMRKALNVRPKGAFAIGNVGKIKATGEAHGATVRIVHDPQPGQPAHAEVRRLPRDDLALLEALATDAFTEIVRNSEVELEP